MSRFIPSWLVTILSFSACAAAQDTDSWRLDTDAINQFVATYQDHYRVPGVAVVVTSGAEIVYAAGYGQDADGRSISSRTPFPIASLSKAFTSLAVMQLAEDGRIDLDEPVRRYLPGFELADARGNLITIRQLLEHTSGMSDMAFPEKSVPTPKSLEDAVAMLRSATLAAEPGTMRFYHNPNYWVAARLVEVVSGQEFGRYLKERIIVPLGMHDTFAVTSLDDAPGLANGYVRLFGYPISLPEPSWFLGGCCGILSTAEDMGRWLAFHNTGITQTGAPLISAAGLNELHQGLGWNRYMRGDQIGFTHNGILFTFSGRQYVLPEVADGLGIAVMTTTGIGLAAVDSDAIAQEVLAIAEGRSADASGPSGLLVDMVLVSLCLITVCLGVLALRRSSSWASARRNRARWRIVGVQLPCVIPVALLFFYPDVIGMVAGGRDANWIQSLYISIPMFTFVVIWAATSSVVIAARIAALRRISAANALVAVATLRSGLDESRTV
jgi:CubicO group peptidase (beta-lactamase class C family)